MKVFFVVGEYKDDYRDEDSGYHIASTKAHRTEAAATDEMYRIMTAEFNHADIYDYSIEWLELWALAAIQLMLED